MSLLRNIDHWLITHLRIAVTAIALFSIAVLDCAVTSPTACTAPNIPSRVSIDHKVLVLEGYIGPDLVESVVVALSQTTTPIQAIRITSYGGENQSMTKLVSAVSQLGEIPVEVPLTCQSACVGFLANTSGPKYVNPRATLMFHSASTNSAPHWGEPRCWCFTFWDMLSSIYNSFKASLIGQDQRHAMTPWAAQLTNQLPILFALCPIDPLDTQRGMILTGQEFNDLREDRISPESLANKCPPGDP